MKLTTLNIFGVAVMAFAKVNNIQGGFIAKGKTVQEAINNVFASINAYSLNK